MADRDRATVSEYLRSPAVSLSGHPSHLKRGNCHRLSSKTHRD